MTRHLRSACFVAVLLFMILLPETTFAAPSSQPKTPGFGWRFEYDKLGRISSLTDPARRKTSLHYTQYQHGGLSSLTEQRPSGTKVKFKFDNAGRRTEMTDDAGSVQYVYDKFGRLSKVQRKGALGITYSYDGLHRVKSMSIGSQFTIRYAYDYRGRPTKIGTPAGVIRMSYNSKTGGVTRRLPNNMTTRWEFSPDGRLLSITHRSSENRVLAQYQYTYRLDGLITTIRERTNSVVKVHNYRYDTAQRLISESVGASRIEYGYDKFGNRTKLRQQGQNPVTAQYDWAGRLTHYNGRACQHDAVGNLISATGSAKSFTFDDTGLLKTAAASQGNINYRYDGDGSLISRSAGAVTETFLPDPLSDIWQPMMVKRANGKHTYYIWDGSTPLLAITEKQVRYFLHDHVGSVRLVTDRKGKILERRDFTPYGQAERELAGENLQPGFAGLFFDKVAAVYLTRARAYDPELGRFLQPDPEHRVPVGSQKDLSAYAYCGGDPVNYVDQDGAQPKYYWNVHRIMSAIRADFTRLWQPQSNLGALREGFTDTIRDTTFDAFKDASRVYKPIRISVGSRFTTIDMTEKFSSKFIRGVGKYTPTMLNIYEAGKSGYAAREMWKQGNYVSGAVEIAKPIYGVTAGVALTSAIASAPLHITAAGAIVAAPATATFAVGVGVAYATERTFTMARLGAGILDTKRKQYGFFGSGGMEGQIKSNIDRHVSTMRNQGRSNQEIWNSLDRFGVSQDQRSRYITDGGGLSYRGPNTNSFSGFNQSKVGGIRLTGAGNALSHLGGLQGIALDETNGRLVLIGHGKSPINLPPLRLDDVVTIFRSVYLHGEAPSVTIDPISDKKTEKWMNVIHGKGTEDTYVGWVLYEADRMMKNYGLGKDNKTRKKIHSRVPGYRDFNAIGPRSRKSQWERFWIVPASLTRTQGTTTDLTLFDIPLKLKTEKMEWNGTKLVTAKDPTPSKSAKAYTKWFTSQYDKLAEEVKLTPPKHYGIEKPVAIYQELRRIALITGIAETLRDQNVPFPAWMYDYPVKPCISDRQTPVLTVTGDGYEVTGGVQLMADVKNISTHTGNSDVTELAKVVSRKIANRPLFAPVSFQQKGKAYTAVTIPGSDTRRSGANILQHSDLNAAALQDAGIQFSRHFNSFFDPRGIFGRGWTLDLPKLEAQRQPVGRTETSISYKTVYQLSSPLNSWSERFAEVRLVPELNKQLIVPATSGQILGLDDANLRIIGQKTKKMIFRDGGSWHFDANGYLVARSDAKSIIVYQRNELHKISSIKSYGVQGGRLASGGPRAELQLTYDDEGNFVRSIEARSPELKISVKAHYIYDQNKHLTMVIGPEGTTEYTYKHGFIASITQDDEKLAAFEYNQQGQLQQESRADGRKVAYQRVSTSFGSKIVASDPNSKQPIETLEYDANFRLRGRSFEDGSKIAWRELENGLETTVSQPDGEGYTLLESTDGRQSTMKTSAGVIQTSEFDAEGRLTRTHIEDGPTLEQTWHSDGQLQSAVSDDQAVLPSYARDGKLSSIVVTAPDQARAGQPNQYVKTDYDAKGRVTNISDDAGSQLRIEYDHSDHPSVIRSSRASVRIDRNAKGQVREVDTTWGLTETYDYDESTDDLSRITLQLQTASATQQASIELTDGRISRIHQPDGGEVTLDYYQDEKQKGLLKNVHTSEKLTLAYRYDKATLLKEIDIGESAKPVYRIKYAYDNKGRLIGISYEPARSR